MFLVPAWALSTTVRLADLAPVIAGVKVSETVDCAVVVGIDRGASATVSKTFGTAYTIHQLSW
jgi:hypothetical protein